MSVWGGTSRPTLSESIPTLNATNHVASNATAPLTVNSTSGAAGATASRSSPGIAPNNTAISLRAPRSSTISPAPASTSVVPQRGPTPTEYDIPDDDFAYEYEILDQIEAEVNVSLGRH